MASFKKIRDLGVFSTPPVTGDYIPVATSSGTEVTKRATIRDVIDNYNTQKTAEALAAAGLDSDALADPTTQMEADPDQGGGVQVEFKDGKCVVADDPPLTIGNFRQIIDPLGGLVLTPVYGTADANGCRSFTYQLGVSSGANVYTEFYLLLGKHPVLDVEAAAILKTTVRGDTLHGRDPDDNDGLGTKGKVYDPAPTTTSFVTNLLSEDDGIYVDREILMTSGTAIGERRLISAYDSSTKKITCAAFPAASIADDDEFVIVTSFAYQATIDRKLDTGFILRGVDTGAAPADRLPGGVVGAVVSAPSATSCITNLPSLQDTSYVGLAIVMTSGVRVGNTAVITAYNPVNRQLTWGAGFVGAPAASDLFIITDGAEGTDIEFNDNSWKAGNGWPNKIYCDNWKPKRTTVSLKHLLEFSPTPIDRGNPLEYSPTMASVAYNLGSGYYSGQLVTFNGESFIARTYVQAGQQPKTLGVLNSEFWYVVGNARPYQFNHICRIGAAKWIAKNPGSSGTDSAITADWHQITTTNQPLIDMITNRRQGAAIYNQNYLAGNRHQVNLVVQPFISWEGLKRYVATHLSAASRVTILLRDPDLKVKLADHFYAAYRTGLTNQSIMVHSQLKLPDGKFDFYSPIAGSPRILDMDCSFTCTGNNVTVGESSFDILYWFRCGSAANSVWQNMHLKIHGLSDGPHFNVTRFDDGSGQFGELIFDFSDNTAPNVNGRLNLMYFFSNPAGGYWNLNAFYSMEALKTVGPNGTNAWQTLMRVDNNGTYEDSNFYPVANTRGIKFCLEIIGNDDVNLENILAIQDDSRMRHFFWTTSNFGHWDPAIGAGGGWRNTPAGPNTSTRFMSNFGYVAGYMYMADKTKLYATSTCCLEDATNNLNVGGGQIKGVVVAGVGWSLDHNNGITNNANYQTDTTPGHKFQNAATWSFLNAPTQGDFKLINSNTQTKKDDGTLNAAERVATNYPESAWPTYFGAGAPSYVYSPTALGSAVGAAGNEFKTTEAGGIYTTAIQFTDLYTTSPAAFIQASNKNIVIPTTDVPQINDTIYPDAN